jgi:aspartate aminotransferase/aromatic-amino-acid transaminase
MSFLNHASSGKKMVDKVFKAAIKAKEDQQQYGNDVVVNATLGTLFDDSGTFVAFESVWSSFNDVPNIQKAKYAASIQGNPRFRDTVYTWLFNNHAVPAEIIATPGGAGAVSATMKNILEPGNTVIKPSLAWGPYTTMAAEFGFGLTEYNLFKDDQFDLESFQETCQSVMDQEGKVLAIINDPCHNPSGYTMTSDEWDQVLAILGDLGTKGPVILLHDIAYVDYSTNPNWKDGFSRYQALPDNVMIVIAFSLSKTLTAYGMRVGAAVAITSDEEQRNAFKDAMIYSARSIWSTVNNSIMEHFATIVSTPDFRQQFLTEKETYIKLIKARADVFIKEAKECGLPLYPHKEGFFATIPVENKEKERLNLALQKEHIFLVEVNNGLRVALCSVPTNKLYGLAARIERILFS